MWRRVDLVWIDVSEEHMTSNFRVEEMETIRTSETSFYIISTRRHIPEDDILQSHRRKYLKSYIYFFLFT
jgi:hypothetical protein